MKMKSEGLPKPFVWKDLQGGMHYPATMGSRHIGYILHYIVEGKLKLDPSNDLEEAKRIFTEELNRRQNNAPYWTSLTEHLNDKHQKRGVPVEHLSEGPDAETDEQCQAESLPGSEGGQVR